MVDAVSIGDRRIGPGNPCFIIAEAGVNHNGDLELAKHLIDAAKEAGADAVKFQTWVTEKLMLPETPLATYQRRNLGKELSQFEMAKQLELSYQDFRDLQSHANSRGILFFSTPDEEDSADFLDELGVPLFKIGSGEVTNLPFLHHLSLKGKPMILSTGMSNLSEVEAAVQVIEEAGNQQLVLLHCVSNYPAEPADCNLRAMDTLRAAFQYPVGFSDHTLGTHVSTAAVALGACVLEKHFTLDKGLTGPDHQASLEPAELAQLVIGIRTTEESLGNGRKEPAASEINTATVVRKSLVAAQTITAGTVLTEKMIAIKRAGDGLPPSLHRQLVGRSARVDIAEHTLFGLEMLE